MKVRVTFKVEKVEPAIETRRVADGVVEVKKIGTKVSKGGK